MQLMYAMLCQVLTDMLAEIERLDLGGFVTGCFVLKPSIGSCKSGFKKVKTVVRGGFCPPPTQKFTVFYLLRSREVIS